MIASSRSSLNQRSLGMVVTLMILALVGGIVSGCGNTSMRQPNGRWEVVAQAGDVSKRLAQSLPSTVGDEIEFLSKGQLKITGSESDSGTMQYSFPDPTHLKIEDSTGRLDVVEYSLADNVLSLSDGIITLTLKLYKDLDPTPANLAGTWTISHDSLGNQDDSITIRGALSDVFDLLGAIMGGENKPPAERCLVTDHQEGIAGSVDSYSPTEITFGADETLSMQDRFESTWQGQFDAGPPGPPDLSVSADKTPHGSDGDPFANIQANCRVVLLTNAKLVLGTTDNVLLKYLRAPAIDAPIATDVTTPPLERLTPSPTTVQGDWMVGGGGNGGIHLSADGTAGVSGWGLGAGASGMYLYPATYRVEDNRLYITIDEISGTYPPPQPPVMDMVFTIVDLTRDSLTLQGDQIQTAFNTAPPLMLFRPHW